MKKLLVVDDEPDIRLLLKKFFEKKDFGVAIADRGEEAIQLLKKEPFDVALCDFRLPDYTGLEMLQKMKLLHPSMQVIIITGYSDVRIAVDALKKGAFDYVTKPLFPDEIALTVHNALKQRDSSAAQDTQEPKRTPNSKPRPSSYVVGPSRQSQTVLKHIGLIAPTDMSVIIQGETGTGKEYVARAIHEKSQRADSAFVAVDCGALPKELAGSELFGHVKGAFTGAVQDKKGFFELANGGTLFLDEIGNLSYENQIKLLRVLQERMIKPVGGTKDITIDVRVIAATNEDLREAVGDGTFREDIYHRINEFKIELSALRERPDDIEFFADHFLADANAQLQKEVATFDPKVTNTFRAYSWHGNLRELRNVVKRATLLAPSKAITIECLPVEITEINAVGADDIEINFHGGVPGSLKEVAEQAEKEAILAVLRQTNNNKTKTAELLQVDRKTLYNKLKTYGLEDV